MNPAHAQLAASLFGDSGSTTSRPRAGAVRRPAAASAVSTLYVLTKSNAVDCQQTVLRLAVSFASDGPGAHACWPDMCSDDPEVKRGTVVVAPAHCPVPTCSTSICWASWAAGPFSAALPHLLRCLCHDPGHLPVLHRHVTGHTRCAAMQLPVILAPRGLDSPQTTTARRSSGKAE